MTGALQISRCLTLLSQDEGAATAFFSRLHEIAGVPSAAKILAMLVRCAVIAAVNSDEGGGETPLQEAAEGELDEKKGGRGKRKGFEGEGGKGKDKGEKRTLKASDSKVMVGVQYGDIQYLSFFAFWCRLEGMFASVCVRVCVREREV